MTHQQTRILIMHLLFSGALLLLFLLITPHTAYAAECTGKTALDPRNLAACLQSDNSSFSWIVDTWRFSLSLVNAFAALVLIFIAFANILYPVQALEPYRIRQLLPTFIWGVILANLSLFICRAVVSTADILLSAPDIQVHLTEIYKKWGIAISRLGSQGTIGAMFQNGIDFADGGKLIFQLIISIIYIYLPIIVLFILGVVFFFRAAVIFLLTAFSPLAFGAIIFPPTRKYLALWWNSMWKWAFGGVGSYILLRLAVQIAQPPQQAGKVDIANLVTYALSIIIMWYAAKLPQNLDTIASTLTATTKNLSKQAGSLGLKTVGFVGSKGAEAASYGLARNVRTQQDKLKGLTPGTAAYDAQQKKLRGAQNLYTAGHLRAIAKDNLAALGKERERTQGIAFTTNPQRLKWLENSLGREGAIKYLSNAHKEVTKDVTIDRVEKELKSEDALLRSLNNDQLRGLMADDKNTIDAVMAANPGRTLAEITGVGNYLRKYRSLSYYQMPRNPALRATAFEAMRDQALAFAVVPTTVQTQQTAQQVRNIPSTNFTVTPSGTTAAGAAAAVTSAGAVSGLTNVIGNAAQQQNLAQQTGIAAAEYNPQLQRLVERTGRPNQSIAQIANLREPIGAPTGGMTTEELQTITKDQVKQNLQKMNQRFTEIETLVKQDPTAIQRTEIQQELFRADPTLEQEYQTNITTNVTERQQRVLKTIETTRLRIEKTLETLNQEGPAAEKIMAKTRGYLEILPKAGAVQDQTGPQQMAIDEGAKVKAQLANPAEITSAGIVAPAPQPASQATPLPNLPEAETIAQSDTNVIPAAQQTQTPVATPETTPPNPPTNP